MKTGNVHLFRVLTIAAMLLLASRSQAIFTPYLSGVSNGIAAYATTLTNASDRAQARVVARVLKDFSKPSTSVAGDYNLFLQAALHLGPFVLQPPFGEVGSNAFLYFMSEAQTNLFVTAARIGALNDFVRTKKAASNQLARAGATLASIGTISDPRIGLLVGGQVFARLTAANKLAAIGEARPGLAAGSLVGATLHHTERNDSGDIDFTDAVNATETETGGTPEAITYTYTRTGLNTATLVLIESVDTTTTVKLRFTSASGGTFTYRNVDSGRTESGSGTFTLTR